MMCATIEQVEHSSAGVLGWAAYDGPSIRFEPNPISSSRPRQEILRNRRRKNADYYMTDEGQRELQRLAEDRNSPPTGGLSILNYSRGCLSAATTQGGSSGGWVMLELTADSGACDSVMPRTGPCEGIRIWPSIQSERGFAYEVANGDELPCLGERRLEVATEGSGILRAMAIQVADVHKLLLSLSRCADAGYESRFGRTYGCLFDTTNGGVIPLERRGNLYFLKCWVREAPNASEPFGRQR